MSDHDDIGLKDFEVEYRKRGAYHHSQRGFHGWWTRDNYRRLASWSRTTGRTLDLACGDGGLWPFLEGSNIVGADHSLTGLRHARRYARFPLVQANMVRLPFKARAFAVAVCSLSFQYLTPPDLDACLGELARVLEPGGGLAISYPNRDALRRPDPTHAALPVRAFLGRLTAAGFGIRSVRGISLPLPAFAVRWSARPWLRPAAFGIYAASRIGRLLPRRAHHVAVWCSSAGRAEEDRA